MRRCLFGGAPRGGQLAEILRMPHIVIATPGRLLDFAEGGQLDLTKVSVQLAHWATGLKGDYIL